MPPDARTLGLAPLAGPGASGGLVTLVLAPSSAWVGGGTAAVTFEREAGAVLEPEARAAEAKASLEARARRGDPEALERIVATELPRVERLLVKLLGRRHDLEDLVQNVFLEACRALPSFRGESTLSTFIGGITVRVARRAMRPEAWWRRRGPMPEDPAHEASGPEDNAHAAEQLRRARAALDRIAPKKRVAFLLWALEGMSVEDIASTTGASISATRSQIFYARKELEKQAARDPYLRELLGEVDRDP